MKSSVRLCTVQCLFHNQSNNTRTVSWLFSCDVADGPKRRENGSKMKLLLLNE